MNRVYIPQKSAVMLQEYGCQFQFDRIVNTRPLEIAHLPQESYSDTRFLVGR